MSNSSDEDTNSDNDFIDLTPLWRDYPFITDYMDKDDGYGMKKKNDKKKSKKRVVFNEVGPPIVLELRPIAEIEKEAMNKLPKKKGKTLEKKSKKRKEPHKSHFRQPVWHPPHVGPLEDRPQCSYHNSYTGNSRQIQSTQPKSTKDEQKRLSKNRSFTNLQDIESNIEFTKSPIYSDSESTISSENIYN